MDFIHRLKPNILIIMLDYYETKIYTVKFYEKNF